MTFKEWCEKNDKMHLMNEWDYKKNKKKPSQYTWCSGLKVWWLCKEGHSYESTIAHRVSENNGCPYCSNRKILKGFNDFETWCIQNNRLDLIKEWDYEENDKIDIVPQNISSGSHKKVHWICENGHKWEAVIYSRINGNKCPICSNKKILKGVNDLETWCKKNNRIDLLKEWNYEENNKLSITPQNISFGSSKKVYWVCEKGHEWKAVINSRVKGNRCPQCSHTGTSFPEQAILFYVKKYFSDAIHRYKENNFELDIYIPSIKIAIEYDSFFYHKNKYRQENIKNKFCKNKNITLIRVREKGLCDFDDCICVFKDNDSIEELQKIIVNILKIVNIDDAKVDICKDNLLILENYNCSIREKSLIAKRPQLIQEWNFKKNGKLMPYYFTYGSNQKVWWICKQNHEWEATIKSRINGNGCPVCSGKKILPEFNDLKTYCKNNKLEYILQEWDYEKNSFKPNEITPFSNKKIFWKCSKGHSYCSNLYDKIRKDNRQIKECPICKKQK